MGQVVIWTQNVKTLLSACLSVTTFTQQCFGVVCMSVSLSAIWLAAVTQGLTVVGSGESSVTAQQEEHKTTNYWEVCVCDYNVMITLFPAVIREDLLLSPQETHTQCLCCFFLCFSCHHGCNNMNNSRVMNQKWIGICRSHGLWRQINDVTSLLFINLFSSGHMTFFTCCDLLSSLTCFQFYTKTDTDTGSSGERSNKGGAAGSCDMGLLGWMWPHDETLLVLALVLILVLDLILSWESLFHFKGRHALPWCVYESVCVRSLVLSWRT